MLLCAALCTLVGMNDMAAPSVSLEGKSLWLAQSLPVTSWQVLRAKLRMHLLLTAVPAALCGICVAVVSPAGAAQTALALVVAALFTVLSALLCLFLGLKMPNLHWTSEITPIKQGGAVALALLGGVVYAALLAAGFFLIGWRIGYMAFMAAFAVVTLAACAAAPLAQDEGLHRVCKSVKKVPCGYVHKKFAVCARHSVPRRLYRA